MGHPHEPTEMPAGLRFRLALGLISTIRLLVPGDLRNRWTAEWRAEIWHRAGRSGSLTPTFAALPHAASLRWQHWSPEAMFQDFRYALRQARKTPGISALIVLTMALGIGANSLVYSVLSSTVLEPLPFEDAESIVYVWRQHPTNSWWMSPSMADIVQWREQIDGLARIETMSGITYTVTGLDEPLRINGALVSSGFFGFMGAAPQLGRGFVPEEGRGGDNKVVVVSHRLWRGQLGGREDILGQTLRLDDELHTIVGVMPASFKMQSPFALAQLWTPLVESEADRGVNAIGRLAPGATITQVNEELRAAGTSGDSGIDDWLGQARRPVDFLSAEYTRTVWSLQAAVALVLLIATANVVNLLLARGSVRQQEMAVRAAIGGSRSRLVRQLLTESTLLTVTGGTIGLAVAAAGVQLLDQFRPDQLGGLGTLRLDPNVIFATLGVTVLAGVVAGFLPALQGAGGNLQERMAALSGRVSEGDARRRARSALVVAEVALSTVLVVTAGLLVGSFLHLQQVDPGFRADELLTMRVSTSDARYPEAADAEHFWDEVTHSVQTALGDRAEAIALSVGVPPRMGAEFGQPILEDGPLERELSGVTALTWVSDSYFDTLQIDWHAGGTFPAVQTDEIPLVVNQDFAEQIWPADEALGQRIRFGEGEDEPWKRVVGIVANVKAFGLMSTGGQRQIYYPLQAGEHFNQLGNGSLMLTIRTKGDALDAMPIVRQAIWSVDTDAPITELATMRERLADTIALPRFNAWLMTGLAVVALGLALVGVYGVLSYSVARRTHELGVRMALGATRRAVLTLVGRTSLGLVGAGLALGVAGGAAASQLLESMLHGVQPTDPRAYVVAALTLLAVGVLATWLPAARATRVDPAVALRDD